MLRQLFGQQSPIERVPRAAVCAVHKRIKQQGARFGKAGAGCLNIVRALHADGLQKRALERLAKFGRLVAVELERVDGDVRQNVADIRFRFVHKQRHRLHKRRQAADNALCLLHRYAAFAAGKKHQTDSIGA